jgi:hypothetical protein
MLGMMWVVPCALRVRRHLYTEPTLAAAKSFGQESVGEEVCSVGLYSALSSCAVTIAVVCASIALVLCSLFL